MGQEISRTSFTSSEHQQFSTQLARDLEALEIVLARPGFGAGAPTIGVELELNLIDAEGRPLLRNREVADAAHDPRVTLELDRFNIEINGSPRPLAGRPFRGLGAEITELLELLRGSAAVQGGRVAMIGILPTLCPEHLGPEVLTDAARYHALQEGLRRLRRGPVQLHIDGEDPLELERDDVSFEGAATSLQIHLRVPAAEFADTYNAAQAATALVLAGAGNSPLFLAHRLWSETRIALFQRSVEDRAWPDEEDWRPARVSFGHGWVRRGALELFTESVMHHVPLLPVPSREPDPIAVARAGATPHLCALRLHHGTIWRWNRAVYDPTAAGHLRIELRALPAGPTIADMQANAAFALGLTLGLKPRVEALVSSLTFGHARRNFYAAARYGLDAELLWPSEQAPSPRPYRAAELIARLLPVAREGLLSAGVESDEIDAQLAVIAERARTGRTGAGWQRRTLAALERRRSRPEALTLMLERYMKFVDTGAPVHRWPLMEN